MKKEGRFEMQKMEGLGRLEASTIDNETLSRFVRVYKERGPNFVEFHLSKEMDFDFGLVGVQELLNLAEEKGLMDKLYNEVSASNPAELMEKLVEASKQTLVSESIGGIFVRIGLSPMDLVSDKNRVGYAKAFLQLIDTPEGSKKLKDALDKLGY